MPKICPVGHHCNNTTEMFKCQPGTYQDDENAIICKPCKRGRYCPSPGMIKAIYCHIGTYQNRTGQSECIQCPEKTNCIKGMNSNHNILIDKQNVILFFDFLKLELSILLIVLRDLSV